MDEELKRESMTVIYKFSATRTNLVPRCTKPIAIKTQAHNLMVWAEVNPNMKSDAKLLVEVVPTGGKVPVGYTYIESVIEGPFVWHYYAKVEPL